MDNNVELSATVPCTSDLQDQENWQTMLLRGHKRTTSGHSHNEKYTSAPYGGNRGFAHTPKYTKSWKSHRGAYTPPLGPSVAGSKQWGARPNGHRPSNHRELDMLTCRRERRGGGGPRRGGGGNAAKSPKAKASPRQTPADRSHIHLQGHRI